jgi:hypothetical protein
MRLDAEKPSLCECQELLVRILACHSLLGIFSMIRGSSKADRKRVQESQLQR